MFDFNRVLVQFKLYGTIPRMNIQKVFLSFVAISYFWAHTAFVCLNTLLYAGEHKLYLLGTGLLLLTLAFGFVVGHYLVGRIAQVKVEVGLMPIGAAGMFLSAAVVGLFGQSLYIGVPALFVLAVSSGFYIRPLNEFLSRSSSPDGARSMSVLNNLISGLSVLAGSLIIFSLTVYWDIKASSLFFLASLSTLVVTAAILRAVPYALFRCVVWLFTHLFYRMQVSGLENIPESSGAMIVCNHVSYIDPLLLQAALGRPTRFLIHRKLYNNRWLNPFLRLMKAIPVSPEDGPKTILHSLLEAREAIRGGALVCVFSEGQPTRIGQMLPFKAGFERIMKGLNAPVIPAYIDNIWGSIIDFENGRYSWNRPRDLPYPVTLMFGKPAPTNVKAFDIRQRIQELGTEAFPLRPLHYQLLHAGFIRTAKLHPLKKCLTDVTGRTLNFIQTLQASFILANKIRRVVTSNTRNVGILLPTSIDGAIANLAILMSGKVSINLNYTSSTEAREASVRQSKLSHVITTRAFIEKLGINVAAERMYIEDILPSIGGLRNWPMLAALYFCPSWLIRYFLCKEKLTRNSLATIVFSSGSTGTPKGVMLSHGNITCNIESLYDLLHLSENDVLLGILPFFHSFGFTMVLWLPLVAGITAVYHGNPLEPETVGKLAEREKVTLTMATPTFLMSYTKKCTREQFAHLRWVVAGGEKLRERIAKAFTETFGLTPLEGYGCTELSPVALINVPDYRYKDVQQKGNKPGATGHPLPGQAVRILNPDTLEALAPGERGLLAVKGGNLMVGYLNDPEKTAEVVKDGWYLTGDLASIEEDGFVTIHDRLFRFSKIAGEMVPHLGVEEAILKVLGETQQICAVTAVPDERKGERLVVFSTKELDRRVISKGLHDLGLPNLWIPRDDSFFLIEKIPLLGNGKLDLSSLKKMAAERVLSEGARG